MLGVNKTAQKSQISKIGAMLAFPLRRHSDRLSMFWTAGDGSRSTCHRRNVVLEVYDENARCGGVLSLPCSFLFGGVWENGKRNRFFNHWRLSRYDCFGRLIQTKLMCLRSQQQKNKLYPNPERKGMETPIHLSLTIGRGDRP